MSVLLSIVIYHYFHQLTTAITHFQIGSFRDIQQNWMVFGLTANLDQPQGAVGVVGGVGQHFEEVGLADVVGAGAGHQDAAGAEHLQGAEVEFFVAAEGGVEVALTLGERWRVEDDRVVALTGGGVVLEQIEGIGFDPFDLRLALVAGG